MTMKKRWLKCKVTGTGAKTNPYRPAFEATYRTTATVKQKNEKGELVEVTIPVYPNAVIHKGYNVRYIPPNPPYACCFVEIFCDENAGFPAETIQTEYPSREEFDAAYKEFFAEAEGKLKT